MQTKHCQHCGKIIPADSTFCTYCGAKQEMPVAAMHSNSITQTKPNRFNRIATDRPYPNRHIHMDKAQLTHTDWVMIITNGLSAVVQFLYSAQTMMMPLSKSNGEFYVCLVIVLLGIVFSGLDCWESHLNRLPLLAPALGIVGNVAGIAFAAATSSDVMIILGTIVLCVSFGIMYRQLHSLYRK